MRKYYLYSSGYQQGPFSKEELKAKNINYGTPIWYEGLSDWTSAGNVPELKSIIDFMPPNFIGSRYQTSVANEQKKEASLLIQKIIWYGLKVIAAAFLIMIVYRQLEGDNIAYANEKVKSVVDGIDGEKEHIRNNILSYVGIGNSSYTYRLIGGISNLSLIVTNNSGYMLDDVRVKLSYIKADGSLWKDVYLDFTYIPANKMETIKVPDSERGTSIKYQIVSIKSITLGLN